MSLTRRALTRSAGAALLAPAGGRAEPAAPPLVLTGKPQQGGFLFGRSAPRAQVLADGVEVGRASASGLFVVGFDRDAPALAEISVRTPQGLARQAVQIAPVAYDVQRIDGLPEDQVAPSDPALLERIRRELALKTAALGSRDDSEDFAGGFIWPLEHAIRTSAFGPQRILNGVPKTPHYGVDLAAPEGTPIRAPAPGLVVLAEPAMHFEGGLTLIDHGQGLVSMYLHQSAQQAAAGQRVARGQMIGAVGRTGRATGPHLCWRMTWRGRHMDPSLMVGASA